MISRVLLGIAALRAAVLGVAVLGAAPVLEAQRGAGAGLATTFSTAGDTTVARVTGAVPAGAVRTLVETLRIQPTEADTGLFSVTYKLIVDRRGRAWVFDDEIMTLFVFDASGKLARRIGRRGAGPGEFQHNGGMAVMRDGRVAVLDNRNARVSFFSPAGAYLTSWPVPATSFLAGNALIVDTTDALRLAWRGNFADNLRTLLLLQLKDGGGGFTGDTISFPPSPISGRSILVGTGARGIGIGIPFQPTFSSVWQFRGGFATAHGGTGAITIAQPGGKLVRVERDAPPVRLTADERREAEADVVQTARRVEPTWSWSGPPIPQTKPANSTVLAARDGRIWVSVAGEAELIPEAERGEQRLSGPPPRQWRSATVWEVYEPNGTFIGRVSFPKGGTLRHADGNTVWVIERSELGFSGVVRYRVEPALR